MVLSRYKTRGLLVCTTTICAAVLNLKGTHWRHALREATCKSRRETSHVDCNIQLLLLLAGVKTSCKYFKRNLYIILYTTSYYYSSYGLLQLQFENQNDVLRLSRVSLQYIIGEHFKIRSYTGNTAGFIRLMIS